MAAAEAHQAGHSLAFLHVSYGQRTERREKQSFRTICNFYRVRTRLAVRVDYLKMIGGSALTDPKVALPGGDLDRKDVPASYVPFRNANLLSIATSWTESLKGNFIYIGAVEEDSSGYPDCRAVFFDCFNSVIREGTRPETRIEVVTPLIRMGKAEIVHRGIQLGAPLELTWSCYQDQDIACGRCDSCLLRLRGFRQAGATDPLPYRPL